MRNGTFISTTVACLVAGFSDGPARTDRETYMKSSKRRRPMKGSTHVPEAQVCPTIRVTSAGCGDQNRIQLNRNAPPMTAWGKEQYETTKTDIVINGETVGSSKDPMIKCDPLGWPRWFTYNYGFEFVHCPTDSCSSSTGQYIQNHLDGWPGTSEPSRGRSAMDGFYRKMGRRYAGHRVDRV